MQSQEVKKAPPTTRPGPVVRRDYGIAVTALKNASAKDPEQNPATRHVYQTEDGMIVVKENDGIFYIRHNIIFAKAGDVFYMPRKIPADFEIKAERIISADELSQIETMAFL